MLSMEPGATRCGDRLHSADPDEGFSPDPATAVSGSCSPGPETGPDFGDREPTSTAVENDAGRAEIDTSAPFESVKEAASRFGGMGFWRPAPFKPSLPSPSSSENEAVVDIPSVEEQAALLEKDLIVKERETLGVLKELEATKAMVEELKLKLQKEASELNAALHSHSDDKDVNPPAKTSEKENNENFSSGDQTSTGGLDPCPSSTPGLILMELRQAKLNLTKTTNDLSKIRSTIESYNKKIEKERMSLERTRQRISSNSLKISSLEEELNQTNLKLQVVKDVASTDGSDEPTDISLELQRLTSETEQFKKIGEAARSEVLRVMAEIEHTKAKIKTAEIRLVAAKKMKEAAKATEAAALAEIKALTNSENSNKGLGQEPEMVTLSFEEYMLLTAKAQEAEEASKKRVRDATLEVEEANISNKDILKRVEEATEEVKITKKALEDALNRVEAANSSKLAVEEALRKWRSDRGQRRRSIQNSTKFKNSYPSHHRKDSHLLDVNGLNIISHDSKPILRPTLSIGQILSRKLLLSEEYDNRIQLEKSHAKLRVSLGQMLGKPSSGDLLIRHKAELGMGAVQKQLPAKRKKFGFSRISLLVMKESKKKKRSNASARSGL